MVRILFFSVFLWNFAIAKLVEMMVCKTREILLLLVLVIVAAPRLSAALPGDTIVSNSLCYVVQPEDSMACLVSPVAGYGSENVVVPSTVDGYHVTAIAGGAFSQCQWLTAVSLPASLTAIGEGAFDGCAALTTVFSHVPDASLVLPHVPDGAVLAVDGEYRDSYLQYNGTLKTLVNVDAEPRSADLRDVNHDGVVTAADVTMVYDNLLGYSDENVDANDDGWITSADVTEIYDALLYGNTNGMGDKGYCFASVARVTGRPMARVVERLHLSIGEEMCIVAHDNENAAAIASGFEVMKGPLPYREDVVLPDGVNAIAFNNKHYNTGASSAAVLYFPVGGDTIYYKDVTIEVSRHVVTDTLRVLSIGNSFSLDAFSYMPFIMKAVAPQVFLKLDIMYIGGGSLNEFYNALDSTTWAPVDAGTPTNFTHFWSHGAEPWNAQRDVPMIDVIDSHPWDVIVLQQQSNMSRDYSTYQPYLNQIIDWLDEKAPWQHEYAWLITPSYPDNLPRLAPDTTSVQMFERILQCVGNVQQDTGIELLLPCGTAIQNARTTPLDSLGDLGHLFDYLHLQEGIPCLIEAYAATAALLARYGLSDNVWTDTTWVDEQWLQAKNIQEINGAPVGMSEENRALAKQCAIKALENPLSITVIEQSLK